MIQEQRIISLRKKYLYYSKIKLAKIYQRTFQETISFWKIQRIIEKYQLYPHPLKTARITKKRLAAVKKKRITELKKKPKTNFLICLDAVVVRGNNIRRYIFTAIDCYSKIAFARMYQNNNSLNAADFLNRLLYLTNGQIQNIQTDNGSEFAKHFRQACQQLNLKLTLRHFYTKILLWSQV